MAYKVQDYKTDAHNDWCPGCGDFGILSAIQNALAEMQLPPEQVLLFSGVGCFAKTPHFVRAYSNLGYTLYREGKMAESVFYLSRALQLDPKDDIAHHNLADTFKAMGKDEEAAFHYAEARRLNPVLLKSPYAVPIPPAGDH